MHEQFIALLQEQLKVQSQLEDLQRRIGQAIQGVRNAGNQNRILVSYEGKIYSLERPADVHARAGDFQRFEFKLEGTLLGSG